MQFLKRWKEEDPCDRIAELSQSLPNGLWINILVDNVTRSLDFQVTILGVDVIYADDSFAIAAFRDSYWMIHDSGTYGAHPLYNRLPKGTAAIAGIEFRLQGCDPDDACKKAKAHGFEVLHGPTNTVHHLREAFIVDPDQNIWVPSVFAVDPAIED